VALVVVKEGVDSRSHARQRAVLGRHYLERHRLEEREEREEWEYKGGEGGEGGEGAPSVVSSWRTVQGQTFQGSSSSSSSSSISTYLLHEPE
jgi:hypothetical protein